MARKSIVVQQETWDNLITIKHAWKSRSIDHVFWGLIDIIRVYQEKEEGRKKTIDEAITTLIDEHIKWRGEKG